MEKRSCLRFGIYSITQNHVYCVHFLFVEERNLRFLPFKAFACHLVVGRINLETDVLKPRPVTSYQARRAANVSIKDSVSFLRVSVQQPRI